jgi:hypothetical protein
MTSTPRLATAASIAAVRLRGRHAATTLLALAAVAACGSRAGLPADPAPPATVLNAYLTALRAGDCDVAHALALSSFVIGNGELCGAVHVSAFTPLIGPAGPGDGELVYSTTLTTDGDGVSIPAGDVIWFYALDRQPNGAWRLAGGGSGP